MLHRHAQHADVVEPGRRVSMIQESRLRFGDLPLQGIRQREIRLRRGHRGIERQRARARRLRAGPVAILQREITEVIQREPGLRVESQRKLEGLPGLLPLAQRFENGAERVVRTGRVRLAIDGAVRITQRQLRAAPIAPQPRQPFPRPAIALVEPQRQPPVFVGVIRDAGLAVRVGEQMVTAGRGVHPQPENRTRDPRVLRFERGAERERRAGVGLQRPDAAGKVAELVSLWLDGLHVLRLDGLHVETRCRFPWLDEPAGKRRLPRRAAGDHGECRSGQHSGHESLRTKGADTSLHCRQVHRAGYDSSSRRLLRRHRTGYGTNRTAATTSE